MPKGVRAVAGSVAEQMARFAAQRSQLENEEKKARETIRNGLVARLMKQLGGAGGDLEALEQLVLATERSGLAAVAKAGAELPVKSANGRGRGKDEGSGEKETGAAA